MSYNSGEGVPSPIGRDIDGKYLDENEDEITILFKKWQNEWKEHGVTVMCDSWTGPTRMSIINFLLYSNGRMFYYKSVNATGKSQDAKFLHKVPKLSFIFHSMLNILSIFNDVGYR